MGKRIRWLYVLFRRKVLKNFSKWTEIPTRLTRLRPWDTIHGMEPEQISLSLLPDTHLFSDNSRQMEKLEHKRRVIRLIPGQLFHPTEPAEFIVRLGKLRVSRFLPDGREVTLAVLQAGPEFRTFATGPEGDDPAADIYDLADIVLMALGEGELWALPPGNLRLES